jgi:hypothetical protein
MSEPLLQEIRESRPAAPAELRERVRALAAEEPVREPAWHDRFRLTWGWRRLVLVAPAAVAVALVAGTVIGLTRPGGDEIAAVGRDDATMSSEPALEAQAQDRAAAPPSAGGGVSGGAVAPSPGRLQRYDAELSLRVGDVEELSRATQQAMRIARSLGGHVAAVNYDSTPDGPGFASLTLRIPVARATDAVEQLSGLGTILNQRYGVQDLEATVGDLERQLAETEARVARLVRQLRAAGLTEDERATLQIQLDEARRQVTELRRQLSATRAEGALATITLALSTEDAQAVPAGPSRLDDVREVLEWEAIAALYVAVVLGPLVLLGALVWLALRWARRRETARLLEQN